MAKRPPTKMPKRSQGQPTSVVFPDDMLEWLTTTAIKQGISRAAKIKMCVKAQMDYDLATKRQPS